MKPTNLFALLGFALVLTACEGPNNITGTMAVSPSLTIVGTNGKAVKLAKGSYKTQVTMKSDKSALVTIKAKSGSVKFAIPKGLANFYGSINITAKQMGQAFGLKGAITTSSREFSGTSPSQCLHHYDSDYQCNGRDENGNSICEWVDVPVYGTEDVYEEGYVETKHININLVTGKTAAGKFSGSYQHGRVVTKSEVVSGCSMF